MTVLVRVRVKVKIRQKRHICLPADRLHIGDDILLTVVSVTLYIGIHRVKVTLHRVSERGDTFNVQCLVGIIKVIDYQHRVGIQLTDAIDDLHPIDLEFCYGIIEGLHLLGLINVFVERLKL